MCPRGRHYGGWERVGWAMRGRAYILVGVCSGDEPIRPR